MIVFRPFKHPTKHVFLSGRMRVIRSRNTKGTRALARWMKRRDKWRT